MLGWTEERASQAELVAVPAEQLTAKPPSLSWEVAGSLFVVGMAGVRVGRRGRAEGRRDGGRVGRGRRRRLGRRRSSRGRTGATVIGLASEPNHAWLRAHGIVPVTYGDGQAERIREAAGGGVDAFIDTFGGGYVDLAIELGVAPERINTIIDYEAVERLGVHGQGTHAIAPPPLLAELARAGRRRRARDPDRADLPAGARSARRSASSRIATRTARSCCFPDPGEVGVQRRPVRGPRLRAPAAAALLRPHSARTGAAREPRCLAGSVADGVAINLLLPAKAGRRRRHGDRAGEAGGIVDGRADSGDPFGVLFAVVGKLIAPDPVELGDSASCEVIAFGVSRGSRAGRRARTSMSGSAANSALPLAVQCRGNWTPTAETARRRCEAGS